MKNESIMIYNIIIDNYKNKVNERKYAMHSIFEKYLTILEPYGIPEDEYLQNPEGITMASQAAMAASYLAIGYENDGASIWEDDYQPCVDWLYQNIDGVDVVIDKMNENPDMDDEEYEDLLRKLLDIVADKDLLRKLNVYPAKGSIF